VGDVRERQTGFGVFLLGVVDVAGVADRGVVCGRGGGLGEQIAGFGDAGPPVVEGAAVQGGLRCLLGFAERPESIGSDKSKWAGNAPGPFV